MPELDGYQLTAAIRLAEQGKGKTRAPIIAFTANALKGEAEHCRAVGMDDYLSKPVQLAHLNAILQKWLPVAPPNTQPSPTAPALPGASPPSAPAPPGTPAAAPAPAPTSASATATPSKEGKPVDVSVLEALVGNDPEVISEFLRDFRASSDRIAVELRSACKLGQPDRPLALPLTS